MLYEVTKEIAEILAPLPIHVFFGKERFDQHPIVGENKVKVEQVGGEKWRTAQVARSGPEPKIGTRDIGVRVTVEAKSPKGGANVEDHQREAELFLQWFWHALLVVCHNRGNPLVGHEADGGYVESADNIEIGCRYVLTFQLQRSQFRPAQILNVDGSTLVPRGRVGEASTDPPTTVC